MVAEAVMSPIFLRAILAVLPLLGITRNWLSGILVGTVGVIILLTVLLIFSALRSVLPQKIHSVALFLLFVAGVVWFETLSFGLFSAPPILLVSLCLLIPLDLFRGKKNGKRIFQKSWITGLSFWVLLTGHGIFLELLGGRLGVEFFKLPAGSFFLAGLALTFVPRKKRT